MFLSFISDWEYFKCNFEKLYVLMLSNRWNNYLTKAKEEFDAKFDSFPEIAMICDKYKAIEENNFTGFDCNDLN